MNTYSDWRGAVPEGHEACPGCGAQERISRDHPTGLELGCTRSKKDGEVAC